MRTVYIWGYNGMYPVAVIEDAPEYGDIRLALSNDPNMTPVILYSLSDSQDARLRKLGQGRVTTYKYKPLVGVSEMTDPTGRKTFFEYYDDGRLKCVKDSDGNFINKYDYTISNE
jgi:hypothetical protein